MLRIYYDNNKFELNKFENYKSFITVFKNKEQNTKQYYVYKFQNIHIITDTDNVKSDWKVHFNFYAYESFYPKTKKINFQLKQNPIICQLTNCYEKNGFNNILSFYYLNDLYYDKMITIKNNDFYKNSLIKTSIIMSYFKRNKQLEFTIKTILNSKSTNYELIICNDGSNDNININYPFPIKLITINNKYKEDKKYNNPCIPYNFCIEYIRGENIIIQNPECCHIGDVISYVNNNLNKNNYITFSCLSLNNNNTEYLKQNYYDKNIKNKLIEISKTKQLIYGSNNHINWYIHPKFRPKYYHFTSAIHISNLRKIKGFSELFAYGISYDDDEIVLRIKNLKLNLQIINTDKQFVVHQFHDKVFIQNPNLKKLESINKQIYNDLTSAYKIINEINN